MELILSALPHPKEPFIIRRISAKPLLQLPKATLFLSLVVAIGVFCFRSKIAIGVFYGATIYALASNTISTKSVSIKGLPILAVMMVCAHLLEVRLVFTYN